MDQIPQCQLSWWPSPDLPSVWRLIFLIFRLLSIHRAQTWPQWCIYLCQLLECIWPKWCSYLLLWNRITIFSCFVGLHCSCCYKFWLYKIFRCVLVACDSRELQGPLCAERPGLLGVRHGWFQWLQPTHHRAWLSPSATMVAPRGQSVQGRAKRCLGVRGKVWGTALQHQGERRRCSRHLSRDSPAALGKDHGGASVFWKTEAHE